MANPKIRFLSFHSSGSVAISTAISPFRTCSPPFLRGFPVQSRAPCFHCSISGVFVNARGLHMLFIQISASKRQRRHWIGTLLSAKKCSILLDTVDKSVVLWYNEEKRTGVFLHGEQLSTARYVRCDVGNSQAVHNRKQGNVGRERKGYPSISEWRVLDFENGSTMERPAAGIW